ncbi:hypothetical protein Ocin01_04386 [Orchesella cincta]|uniref:CHK kinase-like domain-containing protein n=1 Tax=Orchesella cincta TaxID=48709 RepID=A0A1D2NAM4_ORCCI|nr:hypothetical protein Ocin01_04386 [Orchesella cincta]
MNDNSGNSSREKTTACWFGTWFLQTYYTYMERKRKQESGGPVVGIKVIDFDIGPGFAGDGRISTLSDLLSLRVRFLISGSDEEKTENWIVKIPPNDRADREMAQMAQVDKREIHFYTEALPELEDWGKSRDASLSVGVPRCYFAKYHNTQPQVEDDDGTILSDAESVLVLEDMRPNGYSMRDFNSGLSLDEAFAALREIATIHALSWAMQETTDDMALDDKWDFAYRPQKAASAYKIMIEQGFPTLADFLDRQQPDGPDILNKLKALHPKAAELLCELLEPPPPPAPSCLTHMDFWCNNLLFRKRTPPDGTASGENGNVVNGNGHCSSSSGDEDGDSGSDTECLIVDWQMMAISRPTHDVALLLFTSLTPEVRQANTEALLKHYWNVFQRTAARLQVELPFDYGVIENEFKKSQLLALLLVIGSIDLALDTHVTERRLLQALRDMAKDDLI